MTIKMCQISLILILTQIPWHSFSCRFYRLSLCKIVILLWYTKQWFQICMNRYDLCPSWQHHNNYISNLFLQDSTRWLSINLHVNALCERNLLHIALCKASEIDDCSYLFSLCLSFLFFTMIHRSIYEQISGTRHIHKLLVRKVITLNITKHQAFDSSYIPFVIHLCPLWYFSVDVGLYVNRSRYILLMCTTLDKYVTNFK